MALLHPGDTFPTFDVQLVGGGSLTLPEALAGGFGVVLFNRGSWCPFCNAQLRGFQRVASDLLDLAPPSSRSPSTTRRPRPRWSRSTS